MLRVLELQHLLRLQQLRRNWYISSILAPIISLARYHNADNFAALRSEKLQVVCRHCPRRARSSAHSPQSRRCLFLLARTLMYSACAPSPLRQRFRHRRPCPSDPLARCTPTTSADVTSRPSVVAPFLACSNKMVCSQGLYICTAKIIRWQSREVGSWKRWNGRGRAWNGRGRAWNGACVDEKCVAWRNTFYRMETVLAKIPIFPDPAFFANTSINCIFIKQ